MPTIQIPGLIDVHTHLRVPGGEAKEDFATGTAAALAGGITTLLAMPNTTPPLSTPAALQEALHLARSQTRCALGLYAGAHPGELPHLPHLAADTIALKIYLNETFGPLRVETLDVLNICFQTWPRHKLIAMHAEDQSVAVGIGLAASYRRPVHFCHISRKEEIELIAEAKQAGLPVTCEVCPHHLYLTEADVEKLGPLGMMRPPLATQADVDALWDHLDSTVDCIATDHAPHTLTEKQAATPPPGVPGLETSLPLMLEAVHQRRLSMERLIALMYHNPQRIFQLPPQNDTFVEIDPDAQHTIHNKDLYTRCGWTPFDGWTVTGRIRRVVLHGQDVVRDGEVLAQPGSGRVLPG